MQRGLIIPSLQTINIFTFLFPAFLSGVLVTDFPADLLQNPLFKLVTEIKQLGGQGRDKKNRQDKEKKEYK